MKSHYNYSFKIFLKVSGGAGGYAHSIIVLILFLIIYILIPLHCCASVDVVLVPVTRPLHFCAQAAGIVHGRFATLRRFCWK